jgi:hypothetical protein
MLQIVCQPRSDIPGDTSTTALASNVKQSGAGSTTPVGCLVVAVQRAANRRSPNAYRCFMNEMDLLVLEDCLNTTSPR